MVKYYPTEDSPNVVARFEHGERLLISQSKEAGRRIMVPCVRVYMKPLNGNSEHSEILDDMDDVKREDTKANCRLAWEAFYSPEDQMDVDGTPIAELEGLTPSRAEEWRKLGILTIEQFSKVPDGTLDRLGPNARLLQRLADQAIEVAKAKAETEMLKLMATREPEPKPRGRPVGAKDKQPRKRRASIE